MAMAMAMAIPTVVTAMVPVGAAMVPDGVVMEPVMAAMAQGGTTVQE